MASNLFLVSRFTSNNWAEIPWILLLLSYIIPERQCAHSLRYFYTGMSQSGELKEFQAMTYVDDQQITTCNKRKIICRPVASWMKDKEDDSYWEDEHVSFRMWQKAFNENLHLLKHRFNNTKGLLILQLWYGCEEQNDGHIRAHYQYGFEGTDYSLFDTITLAWDPIMLTAQIIDEGRNIQRDIMESVKSYLEKICPKALNKYIGYGTDILEWKVRPEAQIVPLKETEHLIRLRCQAYGFHPRAVDVKWMKNGVDHVPSYETSPILPHPDGTYQIRVSMEMQKRDGDTYACHVDHSSLGEEIIILWNPKENRYIVWIKYLTIPGVIVFFLLIVIFLIFFTTKTTKEQDQAHTSPVDYRQTFTPTELFGQNSSNASGRFEVQFQL